ncbi:hypothetical protein RUM43_008412 [Polyplax serrata]|uniref:Uncharacterized protein n=1 Tax=Polyplax serrata TaxID=468196 RepID=A0AAN8NMK2_POLSC
MVKEIATTTTVVIRSPKPDLSKPVAVRWYSVRPMPRPKRSKMIISSEWESDNEWINAPEDENRLIPQAAREIEGLTHPRGRPRKGDHLL